MNGENRLSVRPFACYILTHKKREQNDNTNDTRNGPDPRKSAQRAPPLCPTIPAGQRAASPLRRGRPLRGGAVRRCRQRGRRGHRQPSDADRHGHHHRPDDGHHGAHCHRHGRPRQEAGGPDHRDGHVDLRPDGRSADHSHGAGAHATCPADADTARSPARHGTLPACLLAGHPVHYGLQRGLRHPARSRRLAHAALLRGAGLRGEHRTRLRPCRRTGTARHGRRHRHGALTGRQLSHGAVVPPPQGNGRPPSRGTTSARPAA